MRRSVLSKVLVEGSVFRSETVDEILEGNERFRVGKMSSDSFDLVSLGSSTFESFLDGGESLRPSSRNESVSLANERSSESLRLESITGESSLVVDPFFVDIFIQTRLNSHDDESTRIDTNVTPESVKNVDRFSVLEFPRTSFEGVGFRSEGTNGTEIDNVSRHLRVESLLNVGTNLHVVSTSSCSEVVDSRNFVGESNTTGAVNATSHDGLDERSKVLVLCSTLPCDFVETRPIRTVSH
jgi:hypothetical protein